jgi:hypothetical protein
MILSLFPKGVSMASKAMDPTTTNDINKGLLPGCETIVFGLKNRE